MAIIMNNFKFQKFTICKGGSNISGIVSTLVFMLVISLYLFVIEVFYTIFRFTGLNKDKARFQALSLLTTSGFTTSESEDVLASPKRRKVAMFAMFFGYMFSVVIASSIINLTMGFVGETKGTNLINAVIILVGIVMIFYITRSKRVTNWLNKIIKHRIVKYIATKQEINPIYVLDTHGKFVICEVAITKVPEDLKNKTLVEAEVRQKYDVSVLTLKHGNQIKTMDANRDILSKGDTVIVFGDMSKVKTLFHSDLL